MYDIDTPLCALWNSLADLIASPTAEFSISDYDGELLVRDPVNSQQNFHFNISRPDMCETFTNVPLEVKQLILFLKARRGKWQVYKTSPGDHTVRYSIPVNQDKGLHEVIDLGHDIPLTIYVGEGTGDDSECWCLSFIGEGAAMGGAM